MTTIVYSRNILAADGRITNNGVIQTETQVKIFTPPPGENWTINREEVVAIGYSGGLSTIGWVKKMLGVKTLESGDQYTLPKNTSFQCFIITHTEIWKWECDNEGTVEHQYLYHAGDREDPNFSDAIGSGADFAKAGLTMDITAIGCVQLAGKRCIYTGPQICSIDLSKQSPFLSLFQEEKGNII